MNVVASGMTDIGPRRSRNEDALLVNEELKLYVVADGMGGHAGGSTASAIAINTVEEYMASAELPPRDGTGEPLEVMRGVMTRAVQMASKKVHAYAQRHPEFRGMGTTVVAVVVYGTNALVAHVGDSRVYMHRSGRLEQLTEDHSLVAQSVKEGILTVEQARTHRMKNVITRALGFDDEVEVDVMTRALRPGDTVMLCSDGLSGPVDDAMISDVLGANAPRVATRKLVDLAYEHGGDDNITVLILSIEQAT